MTIRPDTPVLSPRRAAGRGLRTIALTLLAVLTLLAPTPAAAQDAITPLAHVEVAGNGPVPMVLIPGLSCDWTVFRAFMDRNAGRYTMYAVTLPGFGGSSPPPATGAPSDGLWLRNAARAVEAMIREKNLDKPVIVGHSMGAHLAMRIVGESPELARAAVAIDGMPAFPLSDTGEPMSEQDRRALAEGPIQDQMKSIPDEQWRPQQKQWVMTMVKDPARGAVLGDAFSAIPREITTRYMVELMAADASAVVRAATTPILAIAAIPDEGETGVQAAPIRQVWEVIARSSPSVKVVFFENTRHFVTEDAPAELDKAIEDFLAGREVVGRPAAAAGGAK